MTPIHQRWEQRIAVVESDVQRLHSIAAIQRGGLAPNKNRLDELCKRIFQNYPFELVPLKCSVYKAAAVITLATGATTFIFSMRDKYLGERDDWWLASMWILGIFFYYLHSQNKPGEEVFSGEELVRYQHAEAIKRDLDVLRRLKFSRFEGI